MTGVASFNYNSQYIPGLTRYRLTMAKLHQLQFGRGAQVPQQPTTRMRMDLSQLDYFLGFITSLHLVQDLPFGQKHLKLSSGELIEVPNVIHLIALFNQNWLISNHKKCEAMLIGSKHAVKNTRPLQIVLDGKSMKQSDYFKYLGIYIDHCLTWNKHVNYIQSRIYPKLKLLYRILSFLSCDILL